MIDERTLPLYLKQSIMDWKNKNKFDEVFEGSLWLDLYSSINAAENGYDISSEVAWYLREKYLGMDRNSL